VGALNIGEHLDQVPDLPGRWVVWSKATADYGPGAYFIVPPAGGGGWAVIRAQAKRNDALKPTLTLLHVEKPKVREP
jgi:hypothetical protein